MSIGTSRTILASSIPSMATGRLTGQSSEIITQGQDGLSSETKSPGRWHTTSGRFGFDRSEILSCGNFMGPCVVSEASSDNLLDSLPHCHRKVHGRGLVSGFADSLPASHYPRAFLFLPKGAHAQRRETLRRLAHSFRLAGAFGKSRLKRFRAARYSRLSASSHAVAIAWPIP